jgi:hypothetical protein
VTNRPSIIVMATTVDMLPANLKNSLHEIIERVNLSSGGIRVILLSTAEGVPLGRAYSKEDRDNPHVLNEDVLSNIESTWAPASKQFPLLNMGKEVKMVTAIYDQSEWHSMQNVAFDPNMTHRHPLNFHFQEPSFMSIKHLLW